MRPNNGLNDVGVVCAKWRHRMSLLAEVVAQGLSALHNSQPVHLRSHNAQRQESYGGCAARAPCSVYYSSERTLGVCNDNAGCQHRLTAGYLA